ncbi:MAG: ATP-dependent RecD-like DNA helicase [Oscillospiraceae bacterium]
MKEQEYISVSGSVDNVTYSNSDTGFTVLDLDIGDEIICVVGQLLGVEVGEELKVTGYYTTHSTYGNQFKAQMYERNLPATANAICKYLCSGVVKGIGPVTARRIVDMFGDKTLEVIENTPLRLSEVRGITQEKATKISSEFKEVFGVRTLMLFLQGFNINPMQSVAVWKKWGVFAKELIEKNPYVLCSEDLRIDFSLCDNIAKKMALPIDSVQRISAALSYVLLHNTNNGHTCVPKEKLAMLTNRILEVDYDRLVDTLDDDIYNGVLCSSTTNTEFVFLPQYYKAETYIASRIKLMLKIEQEKATNIDKLLADIEKDDSIVYEKLQREAIEQSLKYDVFILTGGPGTGKTTTLNAIIKVFDKQGKSVALTAPTGRAAKRMSEVTGKEAKTIHRLLEVEYAADDMQKFSKNEENPLDADVIIIDEMSMMDVMLFESLLRGMKIGSKLIMVGDFHQLPSVGAGNVLKDLLNSEIIPTVCLKQIFRQAAKSLIVTNAHSIVNGEMPNLLSKNSDFFFMPMSQELKARATILDLCSTRLPKTYGMSPFDDIQVLSPQRKGDLGVIELNHELQKRLNPPSQQKVEFKSGIYTFRCCDKVMQIRNNYDILWSKDGQKGQGIFNGDIGVIEMIDRGSQTLSINFEGRIAYYSFDMSRELELAYAITVHKSQGSEFEAVILPIMNGYDKLYYRNLLYTAVTRAKRILIILGSEERINFMVDNDRRVLRYTCLKHFLQEGIKTDEN